MRFTSTMMRSFRREGPSLLRLRRLLSVPLTPLALAGAIFALPVMFFGHEAGWVRLVGIVGAMLTSACAVLATWACAADVRRGWRRREIELDTVAFMCGCALTPVVIGLLWYTGSATGA
jgi:hypothetical protein